MEEKITEKTKKIILTLIFSLAVFLIVFHFTDTPRVWVDEGIFTNIAENVSLYGVYGIQTEPGSFFRSATLFTTNYPVIFPVAASFKLFGIGLWQARLPMIIYMFLLVILFYLYTKKRYSFYPAIGTVLLLISFSPFYGNGRAVLGEVPGLVFLVLGTFLLLYLEEANFESKKLAIFSGIFLGLAASTKTLYLGLLIVALPLALIFCIKKINNKKNILLLLVAFLIPIILLFRINYPTLDSMTQIIPTIIHQSGNNGASTMSNTSFSLFNTVIVNLIRFVKESTPILFLFLFIPTVLTFVRRYFKKENWDFNITDHLIFFVIVLNWFGYLLGTGWYRYFFPANVLLYLFFPVSIVALAGFFKKELFKKIAVGTVIALIIFQFFHLIFLSDTSFVSINTMNAETSKALSVVSPTQKVLFYNTIESIVFLKGGNYSQYLTLSGLFELGNKNSLGDVSNDFIFIGSNDEIISVIPSCYLKTSVGKYYLFKKTTNCDK
ncbi:MAG: glycosyltransferase family 39 protein [Candidatus Zambryskibacteria bacterium]|nr:glycosyltransferase family 39 protein [Candidatus Zambryskibacteria bacterium]